MRKPDLRRNGRGSSALKIAVSERNIVSAGNDVPI